MNENSIGTAYETPTEIIICGTPPDEEGLHNCDEMGCGFEHVLYRLARQSNIDELAEGLCSQLFEVEGFGDYTNTQQREGVYELIKTTLALVCVPK